MPKSNSFIEIETKWFELLKAILRIFKKYDIEQILIVLGPSIFTAKEAYIVNLPDITKRTHFHGNQFTNHNLSKQVIR